MTKKIIFFFVFLLFATGAFSYDNLIVHPELTRSAIEIYNRQAGRKLSFEQMNWVVEGSIAEDTDPRYLNHYYDPTTGKGLDSDDTIYGVTKHFTGLPAKEWAKNQDSWTGISGDYSIGAIFKNYRENNFKRAYQGVGHILHLIQDMSVPAHTRNDSHAMGDPYESWAKGNWLININKVSFIPASSIDQTFDSMAFYSHNNFFSKDTIDLKNLSKYKVVDGIYAGRKAKYLANNLSGVEYKLCLIDDSSLLLRCKINDDDKELNSDYWNLLYPKAVGYSAGVIDYFIRQFEQIDQEKKVELSFWQKIINTSDNFKYLLGDNMLAESTAWQEKGTAGYLASKLYNSLGIALTGDQRLAVANQISVELAKSATGQVVNFITNPITFSDLFKPKPTGAATVQPREKVVVLGLESGELPPAPTTPEQNKIVVEPVDLNQADSEIIPSPLPTTELIVKPKSTFIFVAGDSTPPDTFIAASVPAVTGTTTAGFVFSSSEAGDRFQYNFDNSGWLDSGSNLNLANISEGNHILEARAIDNFNNIDPTPATAEWTVDTSAPQIEVAAGPSQFASSTEANFLFEADEEIIFYQCKLDDNDWQACGSSTTLENLIEGEHVLMVEASDLAGNIGSSSRDWFTDLTPPLAAITPLENQYQTTGFIVGWSGDDLSASTTEVSGVASFYLEYKIGSSDWFDWPIGTTSISTVFNLSVAAGEDISFRVRAADQAGNLGQWSAPAETTIKPPLPKHLVISEFATRGPAGAYDEFVELYNPTNSAVSLLGWRIESKAASGTNWINRVGDAYLPDDLILARGYYLIYPATYSVLIGPNFMHPHNWGLADSGGHIRLVNNLGQEVDKVGYGSAIDPETAAADFDLSQGGSLERKAVSSSTAETMAAGGVHSFLGNGYDADNNADDFIWRPQREPQNSLSREPDLLNQNFCAQPLPYFNASLNIRKAIARKDTDPATPDENILVLDFPYATDRGFIMSVHDSSCDLTAVSGIGSAEPASRLIIELGYNQQTNLFNGHFRLCTDNWGNVNKIQGDRCQDGPWWSSNRWFGSNELLGQTEVIIFNNSQYTPWIRVEN